MAYLPGVYLSAHVHESPCLQTVLCPHLSLTTTVSLTGLSLYNQARNSLDLQYVSLAFDQPTPSDQTTSG